METNRRAQIQRSLQSLADSYRVTLELMEQTLALFCEESSLDPLTYFRLHPAHSQRSGQHGFVIDPMLLSVTFRGRVCFLGNTLPFKLLCRLAQRPNTYVTYEDLLAEVWHGVRSDSAVRSVAKMLRNKLRRAGLTELAAAIDGTVPGHYSLKLTP